MRDSAGAVGYYGALDPSRFSLNFIEPGIAAYVRSIAARARIHQDRGETAKAIAAWEEFLRRFEHASGPAEAEVAEARRALTRLRDTAP